MKTAVLAGAATAVAVAAFVIYRKLSESTWEPPVKRDDSNGDIAPSTVSPQFVREVSLGQQQDNSEAARLVRSQLGGWTPDTAREVDAVRPRRNCESLENGRAPRLVGQLGYDDSNANCKVRGIILGIGTPVLYTYSEDADNYDMIRVSEPGVYLFVSGNIERKWFAYDSKSNTVVPREQIAFERIAGRVSRNVGTGGWCGFIAGDREGVYRAQLANLLARTYVIPPGMRLRPNR